MKKLFTKAIEWLRSRVTGIKSEEGKVKREKVEDTQSVSINYDVNFNKPSFGVHIKDIGSLHVRQKSTIVTDGSLPPWGDKRGADNQAKLRLTIPEIEQLLRAKYDLRYNVLTEQSEYRVKGSGVAFEPVTQRVYKTWMADLQADGHNVWWIEGVRIAAESMHIEAYHPVRNYFTSLPEWDGADRLRPLMLRLTDDEVMVGYLCRWMLAFVAQAQGREEALYANSVAPILISEQQGWHKSTFCRMLMPRELRMFYTDCFDLTAESQC